MECRFGEPIAVDDRAAVEYWAVIRVGSSLRTLAGVTILRFNGQGLAVEHQDYWAMTEGRHEWSSDRSRYAAIVSGNTAPNRTGSTPASSR